MFFCVLITLLIRNNLNNQTNNNTCSKIKIYKISYKYVLKHDWYVPVFELALKRNDLMIV